MPASFPKATAIFGAGAVEHGWDPVLEAVSEDTAAGEDAPAKVTPEGANSIFASYVFLLRWLHHALQEAELKEARPPAKKLRESWDSTFTRFQKLKKSICDKIASHQKNNRMIPRPGIAKVLGQYPNHAFAFVNTNWDTVVDHELRRLRFLSQGESALHVHGFYKENAGIYLPSEVGFEPYRTDDTKNTLRVDGGRVITRINQSELLILYGLSLSPLDAELGLLLAAGIHDSQISKIVMVTHACDRAIVEERVRLLVNEQIAKPTYQWIDGEAIGTSS